MVLRAPGLRRGPSRRRPSVRNLCAVSRRLRLLVAASLALVLVAIVATSWRVNTSIVAFLPAGDDRELFEISRALTDSTLTRRMVLSLGVEAGRGASPDGESADADETRAALARAAARLADELEASPRVTKVRRGVEEEAERALFETYFPRRYHFWSLAPERELPEETSDAALTEQARALKDALAGPEGPFVRGLAPRDPLQRFRALLGELDRRRPPELEVVDGQLFSKDGHAILFLELADSPFDGARQRELLDHLEAAVAALPPIGGAAVTLEASGVNRFAVASEEVVRRDLGRISTFSLGGLLLLFAVLFGRPTRLAFFFAPLLAGMLVATSVSLIVFGEIHALSLAFGSAILGVAIDYPVHLSTHHDLGAPGSSPGATLRQLRPSLLLAGATTSAGLLGIGVAGFPGLREMAVFAGAGIVGALGATFLLAGTLSPGGSASRAQRALAARLARWVALGSARRGGARWALVGIVVVAVAGLSSLRWQDDLGALDLPRPELLAEDERVQARVGEAGAGRFLIAQGPDLEAALRRHEQALESLARLRERGSIGGYASVEPLLRSVSLQERNRAVLAAQDHVSARTLDALASVGFVRSGFDPFATELEALLAGEPGAAAPLVWSELRGGPLEPLVAPFLVESLGDRGAAVVTRLQDVTDPAAVRAAFAEVEGVHYFDRRGSLDAMYRDVRARTQRLLGVAAIAVALVALARYRSVKGALRVVLPGWASLLVTLGLLSALGVELNLLHLIALVLVLAMGVDYGIFLADTGRGEAAPPALLGIVVACLSTVLSFGLLGLSSMPALRAIGQTVALGVCANALLAPLVAAASSGSVRPPSSREVRES